MWDLSTLCPGLQKEGAAHCLKYGANGRIDRARQRQRVGGNQESAVMGTALTTYVEECWVASTQGRTSDMIVETSCTYHIVTSIDAFLRFVPVQSVIRKDLCRSAQPQTDGISKQTQKSLLSACHFKHL